MDQNGVINKIYYRRLSLKKRLVASIVKMKDLTPADAIRVAKNGSDASFGTHDLLNRIIEQFREGVCHANHVFVTEKRRL